MPQLQLMPVFKIVKYGLKYTYFKMYVRVVFDLSVEKTLEQNLKQFAAT